MRPVLQRTGGLWIGWPGDSGGEADEDGYANQSLWPLFHEFPSRLRFDPEEREAYSEGNHLFKDAVLERLRPGDLVWIHDYHLMLLPQLLREAAPDTAHG